MNKINFASVILVFTAFNLVSCANYTLQREGNMSDKKITEDPSYVVINDESQPKERRQILRDPAEVVRFPLNDEDKKILETLEKKFDKEENCAGLAAPQIGYSKSMIIFSAPNDPLIKKWRQDLTQTMGKTCWINPSYEPIGSDMHEDYEGCFSVDNLAGPVKRYKKVKYKATLPTGEEVEGEAEGFLARIIQHEIDHLNGLLCIDLVEEGKLLTIDEYRRKRAKAMTSKEAEK